MKVTIIGAGSVGSTIAFTLATTGTSSDIVLIDVNEEKAKGEAMDILQGSPFFGSLSIIAGDYADAKDSDIVIITSGIPRRAGQSRLELAQTNVNIMKDIASKITKYAPKAVYIIVSNPVDVMTYAFHKFSGIPENQIIGSGTMYGATGNMMKKGWIREIMSDEIGMERRRLYQLTDEGRQALRAEIGRLKRMLLNAEGV